MSLHHTDAEACSLCEHKLKEAHPYMADWFRRKKKQHTNLHISWAWRGLDEQERFFQEGRSRCRYPNSPHNKEENGVRCSRALDLFQLDEDGVARFSPKFYFMLNSENEAEGLKIFWGGKFKNFGDAGHYELLNCDKPLKEQT